VHTSEQYLNHYLKESWGFEGFAVTDWNDIEKLVFFHHVAADNKEVRVLNFHHAQPPHADSHLAAHMNTGHQDGAQGWR
jgi:hypothetical protein